MKWARNKRVNAYGNNWNVFNQEFPATPDLAFGATGHAVYQTVMPKLTKMLDNTEPEISRGGVHLILGDDLRADFYEDSFGGLFIYERPKLQKRYAFGMDTSDGGGREFSELVMLDVDGLCVAHYWSNRVQPKEFGRIGYALGMYYNWGLAVPERNAQGIGLVGDLCEGYQGRPYPNIYSYEHRDRISNVIEKRYGFQTNLSSKKHSIANLNESIANDHIKIFSPRILNQLVGFQYVVTKSGKQTYAQVYRCPVSELYPDDSETALRLANEGRLILRAIGTSKDILAEW